jgi:hypothetical protein
LQIFVIAGALQSQEVQIGNGALKFEGKVASGVFWDADDILKYSTTGTPVNQNFSNYHGEDGKVYLWNETEDIAGGLRAELSATYTNGPVGLKVRFRADPALNGFTNTVFDRYAYGWINLFGETMKVTGGFIDLSDNVWGTLGDLDADIGGNGVRIEFKPFNIKPLNGLNLGELNLGVFFLIPNTARDDSKSPLHDADFIQKYGLGNLSVQNVLNEIALGLRWTHTWFYTGMQVQLDSYIDDDEVVIYDTSIARNKVLSNGADEQRFMFGAGVTVLPEMILTAEGDFHGLGNWAVRGIGDIRQTFQYTLSRVPVPYVNRIFIGIKAQELIWGYGADIIKAKIREGVELAPWIQVKPFLGYKITDGFSAALEFGFGGGNLVNTKDGKYFNEKSHFYVKPHLTYIMGNGFEMRAWYKYSVIEYDSMSSNGTPDASNWGRPYKEDQITLVDDITKHQVAIELLWKF